MNELCQLWQVDKSHTTSYHPQSNGMVERNNRKLGDALQALDAAKMSRMSCSPR